MVSKSYRGVLCGGQIEQRQAQPLGVQGVRQPQSQGAAASALSRRLVAGPEPGDSTYLHGVTHRRPCVYWKVQVDLVYAKYAIVVAGYGEHEAGWNTHVCIVAELLGLPVWVRSSCHIPLLPAEMLRKYQLRDPTRVIPWHLAVPQEPNTNCALSIKPGDMVQSQKGNT